MESSQDRNLPASQRRLQQARSDGQTTRSKDLSNLIVLGIGSATLLVLGPVFFDHLKQVFIQQMAFNAATIASPDDMMARVKTVVGLGLLASVGFASLIGIASIAGELAAGGWVGSLKPLTPDISRLNPLAGLGNLFSKQQLINTAKLLVIASVMGWIGWVYLRDSFAEVMAMMMEPPPSAIQHLTHWIVTGLTLLLLTALLAAAVDVPLQRFLFKSRLKMSHQELKQESKDTEGNPHIKGKIRAKQREIANRRSIAAVPKADFVVMNPTHFAVALRYDELTMAAPQVVAKGADLLAMRIREVANAHSIPVLQSPMLARALYAHAEIDQSIPSSLYAAVAQILVYVYRLKAALKGEGPMPAQVPVPDVPAELDPLNQLPIEGVR